MSSKLGNAPMTIVMQTGHNLLCCYLRPYTSFEYAQKGSLCTDVRCQCFSDHPSVRCLLAVCNTREREDKTQFLMGFYIRTNCENDCCITFVFPCHSKVYCDVLQG